MTTGISRIQNAINHVPQTPVPKGELVIEPEFIDDLFKWRGRENISNHPSRENRLIECCRILNLDLVCIQAGKNENPAVIRQLTDAGIFVFWVINGAFQTAMANRGFMEFAADIAQNPESVDHEMKRISRRVIADIKQGISSGAHGILIADDIAFQQNTYIPPEFCERYLLPLWRKQVWAAKNRGIPVFFHSDGNINNVLPMIVEAGFDGLQCIEPAAGMNIRTIKKAYGNDLCLMGNIDPSFLIDPDNVEKPETHPQLTSTVSALIASASVGGGFIFGTCSGLYKDMSPQMVSRMYHLAKSISIPDINPGD